jgi:hypothetical protein
MTAFGRALGWFIEPPPPADPRRVADELEGVATAPVARRAIAGDPLAGPPPAPAPLSALAPPVAPLFAGDPFAAPAHCDTAPLATGPLGVTPVVTSAAVLGRPGEVEPVAAALALALRRQTRAKAAAVALVGAVPPEVTGGGSGAARRLAARLEAHGLDAHVRGRLAWVHLDPGDPHFVPAARRVALVAAPALLAIAAPRTGATDAALVEQDLLVVVTADPEGPLARLAAAGLPGIPVLTVPPLTRGPARSLARAGIRAPRPIRTLLPSGVNP